MSKTNLKHKLYNGECQITKQPIPANPSLYDTDRINPKANGGTYTNENTRLADPVAHMKRHGNYREREQFLDDIKKLIDAREQMRKQLNSSGNRLLAYQRKTDNLDQDTVDYLEDQLSLTNKQLSRIDRKLTKLIKESPHPVAQSAMNVASVGPVTIAYMLAYVDIEKAKNASCLWAYVGLDKPSHDRYEKGVAGGGNKNLRTVLYTLAESAMKNKKSPYRIVYERAKAQKEQSEKLVWTRSTQGKLVQIPWKETKKSHRHGHALRQIMKHFLADWWFVHRAWEGLDTRPLYVEEKLGHTGIVRPEERGWILP